MSVVSVPSLPAGHPVLLGGQGPPWRWVALLLPDPHRVVLGHDPVIVGPFKEVTLELGEKEEGYHIQLSSQCEDVTIPHTGPPPAPAEVLKARTPDLNTQHLPGLRWGGRGSHPRPQRKEELRKAERRGRGRWRQRGSC